MTFEDVIKMVKEESALQFFIENPNCNKRIKEIIIEQFEKLGFEILEDEIVDEEYDYFDMKIDFKLKLNNLYYNRDYYNQDYPELDF